MEDNTNHIDNYLSEKMQNMHFDLNEKHWADAERRLDEEDRKKRPFWILFIALVVLMGVGLSALNKHSVKDDMINTSTNSQPIQLTTTKSAVNNITQTDINTNDISQYGEKKKKNAFITKLPLNEDINGKYGKTSTKIVKGKKREDILLINNNQLEDTKQNLSGSPKVDKVYKSPKQAKQKNKFKHNTLQSEQNDIQNDTKAELNKLLSKSAKPSSINIKENVTAKPKEVQVQFDLPRNDEKTAVRHLGNIPVYRSPEEYQKMNPRYVAGLENYEATKSLVIQLSKKTSDSIRAVLDAQEAVPAKKAARHNQKTFIQDPSGFYAFAGLAAARGYKGNTNNRIVYGFSPSLGLGYHMTFSGRMSLYLTAYMSYINHLNIKETAKQTTYSFDKDSTLLSVTRKNLLHLHLPIQMAYKVLPRHTVYGGLGINVGLNTISLYQDSKANTNEKTFGYMAGLRLFDINANLGYEFAISRKLNVGFYLQNGFMDMTKNEYFNTTYKDNNASGGISLRYKFIK